MFPLTYGDGVEGTYITQVDALTATKRNGLRGVGGTSARTARECAVSITDFVVVFVALGS